ncbi:U-box domain-containing protein 11 isoform X1 [Arachis hypogaea]|uniref:U-box domain-containing protein 11 isoform X1 n=1 Tax=Arachis hypogaea TaxID=3818 RepID=UPI000DEC321F|nr:U-box domain-containing protein 11 [Arachis hypogaea]
MAGEVVGDRTLELLAIVHDIAGMCVGAVGTGSSAAAAAPTPPLPAAIAGDGTFRKDCTDLVRRISLLTHLFEEIKELNKVADSASSSSSESGGGGAAASDGDGGGGAASWSFDVVVALQSAKRLLSVARNFRSNCSSDGAAKTIIFQFQSVTWKLEKLLSNLPYDHLEISEEVREQVDLVRTQLRRATDKYGFMISQMPSYKLSEPLAQEISQVPGRTTSGLHKQHSCPENLSELDKIRTNDGGEVCSRHQGVSRLERARSIPTMSEISLTNVTDTESEENSESKSPPEVKKSEGVLIPEDFLCPISLELMRDPVIVATGQTYERSYIQRWIDCGNTTCPKTQQKLQHLTLTPNYVLRSLISQWCIQHNIEQPTGLTNGKIKKSDGSFIDVTGDIAAIEVLVRKLSSRSVEDCRAAVTEIRSLSKRSTDNRILIAEAGAIPLLVNLLKSEDVLTQDNVVTSILNLSIYENNKGLIMLAGAIPSIVQVLRTGTMEARENAAATLFSLSLADENKIIIGASGAIPALVELLQNGSPRGKKDAATALFNLCIYQGNKGRAIRAGIITALLKMLTDSSKSMVDEALTIMSVLASHQEAKVAIVKASTIPVLIDLLRTGLPRNKENVAAILLALCKRDTENLASLSRLGAVIPLTELSRSGTERAKRKATSLLEHLRMLQQV